MRPLRADDAAVCDTIVASLPHHFGEAGGRADCARAVRSQAGLVVSTGGEVAGFLTWRAWYGTSVEITWMAVRAGCRRSGLGTALIQSLVASVPPETRYLVVTTLSAASPEPGVSDGYAGTRIFYRRSGFEPIWEPAGWWNERNQAVVMVRALPG